MNHWPNRLDVPDAVIEIARRLLDHGYETWAVGGAVRDELLGVSRSDWDLATAARPEKVRELFRPSYPIGIEFGTVGVRGSDGRVYEVTTFRKDLETDGRHAVVEYAQTIDEDLARRDFTINAIAYHPIGHRFHDPFGGREDLDRGLLRSVGNPQQRFAEDYLRVLRGLRFAGRYRLEIEAATWDALTETVPRLPRLSGERVREELLKVLAAPGTASGLGLYRRSGALGVLMPEVAGVSDSRWREDLETIEHLPTDRRLGVRLAVLFATAGEAVEGLMTRLRFSNAEIRDVTALIATLSVPLPAAADVVAARRWLRDVGPESAVDTLRVHLSRAQARGAGTEERARLAAGVRLIRQVLQRGDPVTIGDLAIDGNDLKRIGLEPGPEFGRILARCLEAVIVDPGLNRRETLLRIAESQEPGAP